MSVNWYFYIYKNVLIVLKKFIEIIRKIEHNITVNYTLNLFY